MLKRTLPKRAVCCDVCLLCVRPVRHPHETLFSMPPSRVAPQPPRATSASSTAVIDAFYDEHHSVLEDKISKAVNACMREQPADPSAFVAKHLLGSAAAPKSLEPLEDVEGATEKWTLPAWTKGAGIHRAAAAIIDRAAREAATGDAADPLGYDGWTRTHVHVSTRARTRTHARIRMF